MSIQIRASKARQAIDVTLSCKALHCGRRSKYRGGKDLLRGGDWHRVGNWQDRYVWRVARYPIAVPAWTLVAQHIIGQRQHTGQIDICCPMLAKVGNVEFVLFDLSERHHSLHNEELPLILTLTHISLSPHRSDIDLHPSFYYPRLHKTKQLIIDKSATFVVAHQAQWVGLIRCPLAWKVERAQLLRHG